MPSVTTKNDMPTRPINMPFNTNPMPPPCDTVIKSAGHDGTPLVTSLAYKMPARPSVAPTDRSTPAVSRTSVPAAASRSGIAMLRIRFVRLAQDETSAQSPR